MGSKTSICLLLLYSISYITTMISSWPAPSKHSHYVWEICSLTDWFYQGRIQSSWVPRASLQLGNRCLDKVLPASLCTWLFGLEPSNLRDDLQEEAVVQALMATEASTIGVASPGVPPGSQGAAEAAAVYSSGMVLAQFLWAQTLPIVRLQPPSQFCELSNILAIKSSG